MPRLASIRLASLLVLAAIPAGAAPRLQAPQGGQVRAVVIGVDTYSRLPPAAQLGAAVADARDIAQALTRMGVPTDPLLDAAATRPRVVAAMDRLVTESKPGDLAIVTFAGHGMEVPAYPRLKPPPDGLNWQIALSGYGLKATDPSDVIVNTEMRAWLARLDAKRVDTLVVIDACFGGGMVRSPNVLNGALRVRQLTSMPANADRATFTGIPMTEREMAAQIKAMPAVTFLAGAVSTSVVPEIRNVDPANREQPRGALSYFVARAIEGRAGTDAVLTRAALFDYATRNVQGVMDNQLIDRQPSVDSDAARGQRALFRWTQGEPGPELDEVPVAAETLGVAVSNGPPGLLARAEKGRIPFAAASDVARADLVWDAASGEVQSEGGTILTTRDGSLIGGVVDRTWAVRAINRLAQSRVLKIGLVGKDRVFSPEDRPEFAIEGVQVRYLIVFNIAPDGSVQKLYNGDNRPLDADRWPYRPVVREPFGADVLVAVATVTPASALARWVLEHDQQRVAAQVPALLRTLAAQDPTMRIGTAPLYTRERR